MRIYISADMEGITGLVDADDVQPGGRDYEHGRLAMTADVNAAVQGAVLAGATEVVVNDAHGPMRNLRSDTLDPAARLIRGKPKTMGMIEGLGPGFDAMVCVGYHARAGAHGVLSHSFLGHEIEDMWLDDRPAGEIGLVHAAAAAMGVRLVALTGDDAACAEATAWDPAIAVVPVKYVRSRFAADLRPEAEARAAIRDTVATTLGTIGAGEQVAKPEPSTATAALAVRWQSSAVAETLLGIPGVIQVDTRTVRTAGPPPELFRQFGVWMRVASALTNQPPYC